MYVGRATPGESLERWEERGDSFIALTLHTCVRSRDAARHSGKSA